ncbi:MAG: SDR family NAD(P)-dependent oxidoreductase [Actinomycetota bacterium]|nr:SDR family NAD(P)-dependent oxidoreductase [Actinomycetota bacterium]
MRTAIVTGTAGGIGEAVAQDLARWGWQVYGFDIRAADRTLVTSDLAGFGGSVEPVTVDVADRAAVHAAVAAVLAATGGTLDAVVANAGIRRAGAFEQTPMAEVRRMMAVNLNGAMNVTRAALPGLRAAGSGRLVVVSAIEGLAAVAGSAAYGASKWALEGWAESLAHELHPHGVGVSIVEPSPTRTSLRHGDVSGDPDGPYAALVQGVEAADDRAWARSLDPNTVSATLVAAAEGRRGLRHPVGMSARKRFLARGKVPSSLERRLVGRLAHLDPPKPSPRDPEGVVMVTGCSSGIGLLTAVELARRGRRVAATMRDLSRRGALDAALAEAGVADRVEVLALDVTNPPSIDAAFAQADSWVRIAGDVGRIIGLVNNAGVLAVGPFEEVAPAAVDRMVDVNLLGAMAVTHAALSRMRGHGGRIAFVSSAAAFGGLPGWSGYAATKWGMEGFAESLAHEVGPHGIDVALVEPAVHRTPMVDAAGWQGRRDGPYAALGAAMEAASGRMVEQAGDPTVVARTLAATFDGGRPVLRRPVGRSAWLRWAARGWVPFSVQRRLVARLLG